MTDPYQQSQPQPYGSRPDYGQPSAAPWQQPASGWGAPDAASQPSAGQYGQSQPYGQPSANPYGQPSANPYGQPSAPAYGEPSAPAYADPYGQPSAPVYGQPSANPYGQPSGSAYGDPGQSDQLYGQGGGQQFGGYQPYGAPTYSPQHPQRPSFTFGQAIKAFFQNYADFHGRANRAEYWWSYLFYLVGLLVPLALVILGAATSPVDEYGDMTTPSPLFWIGMAVLFLWGLALFIPSLAIEVRRLHDTNKSGWFLLLRLLGSIGSIILIVFLVGRSEPAGIRFDDPSGRQPATGRDESPTAPGPLVQQ